MKRKLTVALVVFLVGLLTEDARAEDTVVASVSPTTPTWPNLAGRWARLQVTTAVSSVPVLGEVTSKTVGVVLLRIRQVDDRLMIDERVCGLKGESLGGVVKTRFPAPFIRAISGAKKEAFLRRSGTRFEYVEPEQVSVRGARDIQKKDTLPLEMDDPRVVDGDEDGQPGLTVQIDGFVSGEVYVVQRDSSAMFGTLTEKGRIKGRIDWKADQSVLGASQAVLESNPETAPHPDPRQSYFDMRRVPRRATCRDVMKRVSRLFEMP